MALGCVGEEEVGFESGGESQERTGTEEGAVGPVSKEGRQEKKGEVATQVCSMSADVFLRHTAVLLRKRSSSHPCGVGLESPNLSAVHLNLAACNGARLHTATVVMTEWMLCSS